MIGAQKYILSKEFLQKYSTEKVRFLPYSLPYLYVVEEKLLILSELHYLWLLFRFFCQIFFQR